jgi:hypothetical protein
MADTATTEDFKWFDWKTSRVAEGSLGSYYEVWPDGSYFWQDYTGYQISGGPYGGWIDSLGNRGGSWNTPYQITVVNANAPQGTPKPGSGSKAPAATTTTITTTTPAKAPAKAKGAPPPSLTEEAPTEQYIDDYGSLVQIFASGASYYEFADGTWTFKDGHGNQWDGDAAGNYCDSFGNCTGAWDTSGQLFGIPMQTFLIGAGIVAFVLIMGGRRR